MAASRFPGKPAKISVNPSKNRRRRVLSYNQPYKDVETIRTVERIQRSISYFYRLVGESDEDDSDFHGFSNEDINCAQEKFAGLKSESNGIRESIWELQGITKHRKGGDLKKKASLHDSSTGIGSHSDRKFKKKFVNTSRSELSNEHSKKDYLSTKQLVKVDVTKQEQVKTDVPKKGKADLIKKKKSLKNNKSLQGFGKFIASKIGRSSPEIENSATEVNACAVAKGESSRVGSVSNEVLEAKEDISDSLSHIEPQNTLKRAKVKKCIVKKQTAVKNKKKGACDNIELDNSVSNSTKDIKPSKRKFEKKTFLVKSHTKEGSCESVIEPENPEDNKPLLHQPLIVEGKRRWKPSYKMQQGLEGGSSTRSNSCDDRTSVVSAVSAASRGSENAEKDLINKSVKQFVTAMTADANEDPTFEVDPKLKKIQNILATQWDSRLNRSEKNKELNKGGNSGRITPSIRPILRESVLDKKFRGGEKPASAASTSTSEMSESSSGESSATVDLKSGLREEKASPGKFDSKGVEIKSVLNKHVSEDNKSKISEDIISRVGKAKSSTKAKSVLGGKSLEPKTASSPRLSSRRQLSPAPSTKTKEVSSEANKEESDLKDGNVQEAIGEHSLAKNDVSSAESKEVSEEQKAVHEELGGGWYKKAVKDTSGKWEVELLSPDLKVIRSAKELKKYVVKTGAVIDKDVVNFVLPKEKHLVVRHLVEDEVMNIDIEEKAEDKTKEVNADITTGEVETSLRTENKAPSPIHGIRSTRVSRKTAKSESVAQKQAQKIKKKALRERTEALKMKSMEEDSAEDSVALVKKRESRTPKKFAAFHSTASNQKNHDNDTVDNSVEIKKDNAVTGTANDKGGTVLTDVIISVKQIKSTPRQIAMAKEDIIRLGNSEKPSAPSSPKPEVISAKVPRIKSANSKQSSISPSRTASLRRSANSEQSSTSPSRAASLRRSDNSSTSTPSSVRSSLLKSDKSENSSPSRSGSVSKKPSLRKSAKMENSPKTSVASPAKPSPRKPADSEISAPTTISKSSSIGKSSSRKLPKSESVSTSSLYQAEIKSPKASPRALKTSATVSPKLPQPLFQERTRRGKRQSSLMVEKAVKALAARSKRGNVTAKPSSARWKSGKFICAVCGKDCGYKQNLFFHMRKHEKYGENVAIQNEKLVQRNAKGSKKVGRKKTKPVSQSKEDDLVDIESVEQTKAVAAVKSRVGVEAVQHEDQSEDKEPEVGDGRRKKKRWNKGIYLCSECNKDCGFPENLQIHERKHARQLAKLQAKIFSKHQKILKQEMKDSRKKLSRKESIDSTASPSPSKNSRSNSPTRWANGVPPARWVWGRFVCDQCEKDCGYSQNLALHRKRTHGLTVRQKTLAGTPPKPTPKPKEVEKTPLYSQKGLLPINKLTASPRIVEGGLVKAMPCKACPECIRPDCGDCNHCWDKKKYGGPGKLKRRCKKRTCRNPKPIGSPSSVSANYVRRLPHFVSSKAGLGTTSIARSKDSGGDRASDEMESCPESRSSSPPPENKQSVQEIRASLEDFIEKGLGKEATDEFGRENMEVDEFALSQKYGAGKCPAEAKQELRTVPISVAHLSPRKCEVSVDYWEQYDPDTAALQGHAVMAESEVAIPELCFLCGSAGHGKMLYCRACCEPFHPFCLHTDDLPQSTKAESCWVCRRCTACKVCGGAENTASGSVGADRRTCVECRDMFHTGCLPVPLREVKHSRPWTCGNCLRCGSCGSASVQHYVEDEPLCSACCQARSRGSYCSVCRGCYEDDDYDLAMMECGKCGGWIHARCEGIDGEEYQVLSYLPDSVEYICKCSDPVRRRKSKTMPLVNSYQPLGLVGTHLTPVPDATPDSPAKNLSSLNSLNPLASSSYVDLGDATSDAAIDSSFVNFGDASTTADNSLIFSVPRASPSPMDAIDDDHDAPLEATDAVDDGLDDDFVTLDSSVMALNFSLSSSPSHA